MEKFFIINVFELYGGTISLKKRLMLFFVSKNEFYLGKSNAVGFVENFIIGF